MERKMILIIRGQIVSESVHYDGNQIHLCVVGPIGIKVVYYVSYESVLDVPRRHSLQTVCPSTRRAVILRLFYGTAVRGIENEHTGKHCS